MELRGQPIPSSSRVGRRTLTFETLTVVQNISLIVPGRRSELSARIHALGGEFGLAVDPDAIVHDLSVGERQRVEIIRCLLLAPELLILDEPASVLPPQSVKRLFETLRALQANGMAILFISHKLDEIKELCETATILRLGKVTGRVDPRTQTASDLATIMIGRAIPPSAAAVAHVPGEKRLELTGLNFINDDPFGVSLERVDLAVRSGEIIGIAGISGNGQKELAALISGEIALSHVARDDIRMMGESVGHLGVAERRRRGFAFVPEDRLGCGAVPEMSLSDNSLLTAHAQGLVERGFIRRDAEETYTRDCISSFDVRTSGPDAEASALSGGNLQKFIVGRELLLQPRFLLVAQPTWGVDVGAASAIRQRLVAMRNAGTAILVISEEIDELFDICDHLHVLYKEHLTTALATSSTTAEQVGACMMGADGPGGNAAQAVERENHV